MCSSDLNVKYYLLGNGSNILFEDAGYRGAVINVSAMKSAIGILENICFPGKDPSLTYDAVVVGADKMLSSLCMTALENSLTGLEFAYGIPGTVGGAVYMNAGAYGGEMNDVLVSVRYLTAEGETVEIPAEQLDLRYRHSIFEENGGCILSAKFHLARGNAADIRARMDDSEQSMGWKAAEYEMKGVPLRVEIGPKDIEKDQCVIARRDSGEKVFVPLGQLEDKVRELLDAVHDGLYARAKRNLEENTYACASLEEVKEKMAQRGGFAKTMWCGDLECELRMKEEAGVSSRCIPFEQEHLGDTCAICGKPAKHMIYWGVAY